MSPGRLDTCTCGENMLWVELDTGSRNPLNLAPLDRLKPGVIAYNPATGRGHALTQAEIDAGKPREWAARGITFHLTHFAVCPHAQRHRGNPRNQQGAKQ